MEFVVEMSYCKQDMAALVRAIRLRRKGLRVLEMISRGCFLFAGGVLVLISLLGIWSAVDLALRGGELALSGLAVEFVFLLLGLLLCARRSSRFTTWLSWRRYKPKGAMLTYTFGGEDFKEHTPNSDHRLDYSVIEDVLESREHYFLFMGANAAHLLRKDAFRQGDPEQFRDFIQEKTGKPVQYIR